MAKWASWQGPNHRCQAGALSFVMGGPRGAGTWAPACPVTQKSCTTLSGPPSSLALSQRPGALLDGFQNSLVLVTNDGSSGRWARPPNCSAQDLHSFHHSPSLRHVVWFNFKEGLCL